MFLHVKDYLGRVDLQGLGDRVFVTNRPSHVQATIQEAGIDTSAYSCQHPSTSTADRQNFPLTTVLLAAGRSSEGDLLPLL